LAHAKRIWDIRLLWYCRQSFPQPSLNLRRSNIHFSLAQWNWRVSLLFFEHQNCPVQKLDRAISVIESLNRSGSSRGASQSTRIVSAWRWRMAQAQKARWASIREGAHSVMGTTKTTGLTIVKCTMSASARRKIAAAQWARWAKFRAPQKKAAYTRKRSNL
jgi:hypothetical protein